MLLFERVRKVNDTPNILKKNISLFTNIKIKFNQNLLKQF